MPRRGRSTRGAANRSRTAENRGESTTAIVATVNNNGRRTQSRSITRSNSNRGHSPTRGRSRSVVNRSQPRNTPSDSEDELATASDDGDGVSTERSHAHATFEEDDEMVEMSVSASQDASFAQSDEDEEDDEVQLSQRVEQDNQPQSPDTPARRRIYERPSSEDEVDEPGSSPAQRMRQIDREMQTKIRQLREMMSGNGMTQSVDELDRMLNEQRGQSVVLANINSNSNRNRYEDGALRSSCIEFD